MILPAEHLFLGNHRNHDILYCFRIENERLLKLFFQIVSDSKG